MRYLTGADAAPVKRVLQRQKSMDPKIPPHARTAHTIASAGGPPQQYAALQAFRRLSDTAGVHSRVALKGAGKHPPSLPHAVAFANKKFEYAPTPQHVQFHLKGKGVPAQSAARGGSIQSFEDAGGVQDPSAIDPTQQMADAGAPTQAPASDAQTPITMDIDGAQHAITSDQLQNLVSQPFDQLIQNPQKALSSWQQIKQSLSNAGNQLVGQQMKNAMTPSGTEIGFGGNGNPNEDNIIPKENWGARSDRAINSGSGDQGEPVTGNAPGVSPAAQAYNAANPQQQLGSPGQPSVADYDRAYGNSMQSRAGLAGRPANPQEKAAIDKMNEQGGTPDIPAPQGEAQQTETLPNGQKRVTEAALGNPKAETQKEAEDIQDQIASEHAQSLGDAVFLKNQGINPGNALTQGVGRASRTSSGQPTRTGGGGQRGQPTRAASAPKAPKAPRAASAPKAPKAPRAPRRVYGRGHAGLGTYQEMADGSAQFLGPQNLTG
jgi:hypothetical protein